MHFVFSRFFLYMRGHAEEVKRVISDRRGGHCTFISSEGFRLTSNSAVPTSSGIRSLSKLGISPSASIIILSFSGEYFHVRVYTWGHEVLAEDIVISTARGIAIRQRLGLFDRPEEWNKNGRRNWKMKHISTAVVHDTTWLYLAKSATVLSVFTLLDYMRLLLPSTERLPLLSTWCAFLLHTVSDVDV